MKTIILLLLPFMLLSQDLMEEKAVNDLRINELNTTISYYQNFIDLYTTEVDGLERRNYTIDSLLSIESSPLPDEGAVNITVESCTGEFPIMQSVTYLIKAKQGDKQANVWKERPAVFGIWSPSKGVIQSHCVAISQNDYNYSLKTYGNGWYWGKAKGYDQTKPHPTDLPTADLITATKSPVSFDIPWPDYASTPGQVSTTYFTYVEESGELYVHYKSEMASMINALTPRKRHYMSYATTKSSAKKYLDGLQKRNLDDPVVRSFWGL